jgi:hypothetical protein
MLELDPTSIDGQSGRTARARPEPDLARPDQARHYIGTMTFRAGPCRTIGPNCRPRPGTIPFL